MRFGLRARCAEFFTAARTWRVRVIFFPGPWASAGVHVDAAPAVDLHVGWLLLTAGRLRDCEISGWQWPRNPRQDPEWPPEEEA